MTATEHPATTRSLFGLDFVDATSSAEVVPDVRRVAAAERDRWSCTVTPNVDHLVRYSRHPDEQAVAESASVILPDGMPIVWASRLLRRPLRARLTGSDLFAALWPELAAEDIPTLVVAPNEAVAAALTEEHRAARCLVAPMYDADDPTAVDALVDEVATASEEHDAQYLIVGLSMQKTHQLAGRLEQRWTDRRSPHVMLLGASAEFHVGHVERAPRWMQRAGLEWLFRLLRDPRRLARRYLVDDPAFVGLVWKEWRSSR